MIHLKNINYTSTTEKNSDPKDSLVAKKQYSTKSLDKKFNSYNQFVCIPMTKEKKPVIFWKGLTETPKDAFRTEHNIALLTGDINGKVY